MRRPELRGLPPVLRVLCAGYLISLGLAYAVALLFVFTESGMTPKGIGAQFRGGPAASGPAPEGALPPPDGDEALAEPAPEDEVPALGREWRTRDQEMRFPKPLREMILTTHLHLLSISGILFLVGAIFACSSFPERAKGWVIAAGFAGLVLDYACMWGVRYAGPAFAPGVFCFGLLQTLALALQMLAGLKDLLRPGFKGT
jgi:hypothetical protein